jgi:hypothetical protein
MQRLLRSLLLFLLVACTPLATPIPQIETAVSIPATEESKASSTVQSIPTATLVAPTETTSPTPEPGNFPPAVGSRAIFTYYYYWYDIVTKIHLGPHRPSANEDPLTDEPVNLSDVTWRGTKWHRQQIEDMIYAGIDVFLPVYWDGGGNQRWAQGGIESLAQALEEVRLAGQTPPAVAMFYDTNSIAGMDLTLKENQLHIYEDISFFYRTVPRGYWAITEGGQPIVWIWSAAPLRNYDPTFLTTVSELFLNDFGSPPYFVVGTDFVLMKPDQPFEGFDALASWNSMNSHSFTAQFAAVSPGMDERWILSREQDVSIDRENGDYYRRGWAQAMICNTPWLVIETWNEYHEATEIAETIQYGRQYLDMTHRFSQYFKSGQMSPELSLASPFSESSSIQIILDEKNQEQGISMNKSEGDGQHEVASQSGLTGRIMNFGESTGGYLYFRVDDGFYFNQPQPIEIQVEYFDEGFEPVFLEYDAAPCASNWNAEGMYKQVLLAYRQNTKTWKTATLVLTDAYFTGHQNGSADFRLASFNRQPTLVRQIVITKQKEN